MQLTEEIAIQFMPALKKLGCKLVSMPDGSVVVKSIDPALTVSPKFYSVLQIAEWIDWVQSRAKVQDKPFEE